MRSLALFLVAILLCCGALWADINQYYTFMTGTAPYVPINGSVVNIPSADGISGPVDIGFPFHYGENVYTQVKISCCGYITFRLSAAVGIHFNNLASTTSVPILAALWDINFSNSTVMTLLTGAAPSRVFTVQYSGVNWPYDSSNSYDFQIKLFEDGQVNFCYGPANYLSGYGSASIGINMVPGGQGWFLSVNMGSPITVSSSTSYNNISTYPGEGAVFMFVAEPLPVHDLRVVSINGASSLVQNEAGNFTVTVNNHGLVPEDDYTVNLLEGTTVVATTTGPAIAVNETIPISLSWTPAYFGTHILYGEVVSQTDIVPLNNTSDNISVAVFPQSTTPVTLADGTQLTVLPTIVFENTSIIETLYHASLVNHFGTIKAITFYNHFLYNVLNVPTRIWLGTTSLDNLPVTWLSSAQLTQVFDGFVNYLAGNHIICIPLDTPFSYTEQNLVIMVYKPWSDTGNNSNNLFYGLNSGSLFSSLIETSSSDDINPSLPPVVNNAYQSMAKTTFHFVNDVSSPAEQAYIGSEMINSYPNPFSPETTITYDIKENQAVSINVYNLKGQLIRTLVYEYKKAGHHTIIWDGKDSDGVVLPAGIYFVQVKQSGQTRTAKLIKL